MNEEDKNYIERHYHLSWGEDWIRGSRFGIPILHPETGVPECIVPFDKINLPTPKGACLQFNLADRRIDRVWTEPDKYIPRMSKFEFVT